MEPTLTENVNPQGHEMRGEAASELSCNEYTLQIGHSMYASALI